MRVPFFLEPDYADEVCLPNSERLRRKWAGRGGYEAQKTRHALKERGREVGILNFDPERSASQTMASHRLVQWITRTHGLTAAEDLYAELSEVHFVRGRKLNDVAMLAEAALKVNHVPTAKTLAFLADDTQPPTSRAIRETYAFVQELGVHAIPTFVVNGGKHVVQGAAHADEFEKVLRHIQDTHEPLQNPLFADLLGITSRDLFQPTAPFAPCADDDDH
mmetsp:Transcript_17911/g.54774  ORF Transcript_17911/g.54774 Transcript_17911/m.54774 type:complete len:220 (-) Transcript_17911:567-1226(-)